jgi:hypothetical protein
MGIFSCNLSLRFMMNRVIIRITFRNPDQTPVFSNLQAAGSKPAGRTIKK